MSQKVSSEIYSEDSYFTNKKPIVEGNVISILKFTLPKPAILDDEGDFELQRGIKHETDAYKTIELEHSTSTALSLVGLQIWRGSLLLADWLIYNHRKFPNASIILELGAGVGLTSIVASMFNSVICTDVNEGGILNLVEQNFGRNKSKIKFPVSILELNFFSEKFSTEIVNALSNVKIILAADVIYDNDITDAFVNTIQKLLSASPESIIYVALEKRYVFVLADCDSCAPCYDYFLERLEQFHEIESEEVPLDFPQYFVYKRVKELVMWKIYLKQSFHAETTS